ncbi:hypothetical protein Q8A64_16410 [Oxalobacteraceae bacterium R-40]|uniref:Uncharacterized protein n=1 Tax=Keguizhuia sedimenti TaxID=3064264 RepID=A0ABU1BT19_9BURK|nr:hypothetical protein [Oxalobacteraceae bacterium R-40]
MPDLNPFANEEDSLEIGDLTIENRLDQMSIYGDLQITKDRRGLEQAKALKAVLDAVVHALEADENLPEQISTKPADEVDNPFK